MDVTVREAVISAPSLSVTTTETTAVVPSGGEVKVNEEPLSVPMIVALVTDH
jgi:hypothetical protein